MKSSRKVGQSSVVGASQVRDAPIINVVSEFGIRPPPLLLAVEFAQGVVTARDRVDWGRETTRLTWLHKRYILWATSEGFSPQDIASRIGCHRTSVRAVLKSLLKDTILLYHSGFLVRIEAGRTGKSIRYFCRCCGAGISGHPWTGQKRPVEAGLS